MEHGVREKCPKILDVLVGDVVGHALRVVRPGLVPKSYKVALRQSVEALVFGPRVDSLLQKRENFLFRGEDLVV